MRSCALCRSNKLWSFKQLCGTLKYRTCRTNGLAGKVGKELNVSPSWSKHIRNWNVPVLPTFDLGMTLQLFKESNQAPLENWKSWTFSFILRIDDLARLQLGVGQVRPRATDEVHLPHWVRSRIRTLSLGATGRPIGEKSEGHF